MIPIECVKVVSLVCDQRAEVAPVIQALAPTRADIVFGAGAAEGGPLAVAIQIGLRVTRDRSDESVLSIFLDDTYISLLSGEKREMTGCFADDDLLGERPVHKVRGWNIKEQ